MNTEQPLAQGHIEYYPPTTENITKALKDINRANVLRDTVRLNFIAHSLEFAQKKADTERLRIDQVVVYDDPIKRTRGLMSEIWESRIFDNPKTPTQGNKVNI